jgi:hypothetical protein
MLQISHNQRTLSRTFLFYFKLRFNSYAGGMLNFLIFLIFIVTLKYRERLSQSAAAARVGG